jgi:hypothetical protein
LDTQGWSSLSGADYLLLVQAESFYLFVYETLHMTRNDIVHIATLWLEWVQARAALWAHLRNVAATLSALPASLPLSAGLLAALDGNGLTSSSNRCSSALRSPLHAAVALTKPLTKPLDQAPLHVAARGAATWSLGLLGASASASAAAVAASRELTKFLNQDSLMLAQFQCTLLHSGCGFDAEQAARLLARWAFDGCFLTADRFRVAEMAFKELQRQTALQ